MIEHVGERADQVVLARLRPVDVELALGALLGPPRAADAAHPRVQGQRADIAPPDRHAGRDQTLAVAAEQGRHVGTQQPLMHQPVRDPVDLGAALQLVGFPGTPWVFRWSASAPHAALLARASGTDRFFAYLVIRRRSSKPPNATPSTRPQNRTRTLMHSGMPGNPEIALRGQSPVTKASPTVSTAGRAQVPLGAARHRAQQRSGR